MNVMLNVGKVKVWKLRLGLKVLVYDPYNDINTIITGVCGNCGCWKRVLKRKWNKKKLWKKAFYKEKSGEFSNKNIPRIIKFFLFAQWVLEVIR